MESNTFEKFTNCGVISLTAILILPKNFLDLWSNTIEKQGIVNLRSYCQKIYTSVVLSGSELWFLGEEKDAAFPFLFCLYIALDNRSISSNFPVFHTIGNMLSRRVLILHWILFFSTASSSSLSKLFGRFIRDFRKAFKQIFEMFFPLLMPIFLADRFELCTQLTSFNFSSANLD